MKIIYLGFSDNFAISLHSFLLFLPLLARMLKKSLFWDLDALRVMMLFRYFSNFNASWCIHWIRIWRSVKIERKCQELWYKLQTSFCIYLHAFSVCSLQRRTHFSSLCINTHNLVLLKQLSFQKSRKILLNKIMLWAYFCSYIKIFL